MTTSTSTGARGQQHADVHKGAAHRRAVEAVIWGMPAVNFARMLDAAIANGAKANQMVFWSQPVSARNQTLTPNVDTIYLNPFYDTRVGPIVLEIPPARDGAVIVGSVDNAWQNALEDVGPAGADGGKGGKYLITPPDFTGTPPEGHIVLRSDTYQGFVILRSNFSSRRQADIAAAVEHGQHVKIYPLGGNPASTVYVDMHDKDFDATIPYDWRFFEVLHRFVQVEPWLTRDKVMIDLLQALGIAKGSPFAPNDESKALLDDAARTAQLETDVRYQGLFDPPFSPGAHWGVPAAKNVVEGMATGFADPNGYPLRDRAVVYAMGYFSAKHLGAGQYYLMSIVDKQGRPLDGAHTYRLSVPAHAPVNQYWSATAYDRETHALIRGMPRGSRASNSPDIHANADGSIDIYFGAHAPTGKESNLVPVDPQRRFEVLFRFYGPERPLFERTWVLPDIERID